MTKQSYQQKKAENRPFSQGKEPVPYKPKVYSCQKCDGYDYTCQKHTGHNSLYVVQCKAIRDVKPGELEMKL